MNEDVSKKIRVIAFVMTCFMVFYHCGVYDNSFAVNNIDSKCNAELNYIFRIMGTLVMSWFFTITGFLLFNDLTFKNYFSKIKRRCFSLLIPYVFWQSIVVFKNIVLHHAEFSLRGFLHQNFALVMWPDNGPLWYVYAVFLLAIFSPIFLIVFRNKKIGFVILITIVSLIELRGNVKSMKFQRFISYGYIGNILFYFPAYLIGAFYGRFYGGDCLKTNKFTSLK